MLKLILIAAFATFGIANTATANDKIIVGYITVQAGDIDVEARLQHLHSARQIVWLYQNYGRLQSRKQIVTGPRIHLIAYQYDLGPVIWEDVSTSPGMHRVWMPKSVARNTGVFCVRVYGYRIVNVNNLQVRSDGSTSWCENDLARYVDEPWMQGANGGYGFPLILERI